MYSCSPCSVRRLRPLGDLLNPIQNVRSSGYDALSLPVSRILTVISPSINLRAA